MSELENMFGDAMYERADANHKRYSEAYNLGVLGRPCPSLEGLGAEAAAATELGHKRGRETQEFLDRVNGQDPSRDYLNRDHHKRHKWQFLQACIISARGGHE